MAGGRSEFRPFSLPRQYKTLELPDLVRSQLQMHGFLTFPEVWEIVIATTNLECHDHNAIPNIKACLESQIHQPYLVCRGSRVSLFADSGFHPKSRQLAAFHFMGPLQISPQRFVI